MMQKKIQIPIIVLAIIAVIIIGIFLISCAYGALEDKRYDKELEKELSEIDFKIPDEYSKIRYNSYSYEEDNLSCKLYIISYGKYEENFEKWFKGTINVNLNDEVSEMQEVNIGDIKGYSIKVGEKYSDSHYYGFETTNHYYEFEFRSNKVDDNEDIGVSTCYNLEDKIISSIKLK